MTTPATEGRPARAALRELWPWAGSFVMATGIVGVALAVTGRDTAGRVFTAVAGAALAAAAVAVAAGLLRGRGLPGAREPRGLTAVAGTCVVGAGAAHAGRPGLALALLVAGAALWAGLGAGALVRAPWPRGGRLFLPCVATEAVAGLAAMLAPGRDAPWMVAVAVVLAALGLALYAAGLARFDRGELRRGGGQTWVAGGAVAISALAVAEVVLAAEALGVMTGAHDALAGLAVALWAVAAAWLVVLVACEIRWPRLRYDPSRWATVFPVGMYAASAAVVGEAAGIGALETFARGWAWVAVTAGADTATGFARRATGYARVISGSR
ncbi:MAG: hypothetical protein AB7O53_12030 [Thermoleophilia bacterium]